VQGGLKNGLKEPPKSTPLEVIWKELTAVDHGKTQSRHKVTSGAIKS